MPVTSPTPLRAEPTKGPPAGIRSHLVAALALLAAGGDGPAEVVRAVLGDEPRRPSATVAEPFVRVIVATVSRPPTDERSAGLIARACSDALLDVWDAASERHDSSEAVEALDWAYRRAVRALSDTTGSTLSEVDDVCAELVAWATAPC